MTTRGTRWAIVVAVVVAVAAGCETSVFDILPQPNVTTVSDGARAVVIVIDGPRYDHAFGDSTHQFVPRMWNELRPQGTLFTDFRNHSWTRTVSGHANMVTGAWQQLDNEGLERPSSPTIFEYYRAATGRPASDAVIVGGKPKVGVCSYSTDPSYGAVVGANVDLGYATDIDSYQRLIQILQTDSPRLVLATFSQVDQKAHAGVFNDYTRQLEIADSLVELTWQYLQADTSYAGRTYLFVSADHGRHDDAHGGFQNHGDSCDGCERLICLVLGPDVRAGHTVTNRYTQRDICTTLGQILGVPTPMSDGYLMAEMFEPVVSGIFD